MNLVEQRDLKHERIDPIEEPEALDKLATAATQGFLPPEGHCQIVARQAWA